jgi:probable HAF family extracellular repeat protein/YVTN family beta-propeller protein
MPEGVLVMRKKFFAPAIAVLLVLWLSATALAGDATVAGTANATARSSSWIAVDVAFTGDDNGNGHTSYEIATSAGGPFSSTGVDWQKLTGAQEWRANVINVSPATTYYIRVTFADPDGVAGANPQVVGPVTTPASSSNAVTVEAASAVMRGAEIYVSVPVANDANRNSGGTVEIATTAAGPWTRKAGSPSEANLPFHPKRARLRGLAPGTDYWIRVTVNDPDGVAGANPQVVGPVNYAGPENLALGKGISASPGWGCCPSPSHLVDGRIQNDAWFFGFAWTGGTSCWSGGCPPGLNKHATVDLGAPTEFNRAAMWYHDPSSVPLVWKIQYSDDGVNFADAYASSEPICRTATEGMPGAWYQPGCAHEASFAPVTARYVRYLFDDSTLFDGLHGWAVEFEVFNASCEAALTDTGASVAVGIAPSQAVITPNAAEVYVSNYGNGTVSVIDTATDAVTHNISVSSSPDGLAVAPDGSKVYVGHQGGGVTVIDTATKSTTTVNTLGGPVRDLAITPDGSKLYLAMEFAGLKRIDTATNAVSTVSNASCPEGVRVTPNGTTVYVNYQCGGPGGSGGHDAVGRFDVATGAFIGSTTGLPNVGSRLTISPDGAQVWENGGDACSSPYYDHVGCPYTPSGVVNVLSTSNNALQQSIGFAGFSPGLVSFFPDSTRAVVANGLTSLLIFDTTTFNVVDTLAVAGSGSVAFAPNGKAYAPVPNENRVAVLQLSCQQSALTPVFGDLSSPTITYGTAETTLSGTISGAAGTPTGEVEITLDGVTLLAAIQPDGSFAATFGTAALGVDAHPITYHYNGDAIYTSADGNGTLTVTKATPALKVFGGTFAFDGQPHPATGTVTGANGEDLGAPSFTYNGSPAAPVNVGAYNVSAAFAGNDNYEGVTNDSTGIYINDGTPAVGDVGTYWVANLGTLGGLTSTATAVNASGQTVGYSETSSGETHAFLYSGVAMSDLGTLGGSYSIATGINASGQVVGYAQTAAGEFHAFRYANGVMTDLGTLGGADSFAYGINDAGVVVGESQTATGDYRAFRHDGGAMSDLGTLPGGSYSAANSINASGQITGYSQTADGGERAFIYSGGAMSDLGALPGDILSAGTSINDAGQMVGYSSAASGSTHAFLYNGQLRDLGVLSQTADFSRAISLSNEGEAVGHSVNDLSESHGFVFDDARGMRDLNALIPPSAGVSFNNANAVNASGQIVGAGDSGGQTLALLLTPVRATTTTVNDATVGYSDGAQQVTLTANVASSGGAIVDEGTVTFRVRQGSTDIGSPATSPALTNGVAAASYSLPAGTPVGSYTIEATYNDGAKFTASSGNATLTVQKAATSTAIVSSSNPSAFGQSVTFTATITSVGGTPSGSVQFRDGGQPLGTVALNAGTATLTTSALAVGSHAINAEYDGNANFESSASPALTQTVNKASTATSVTSSANPSVFGQSVTFTATVGVVAPGAGTLTGVVQFFDGTTPLGSQTLNQGRAAFTTNALAVGVHSITAKYVGDANFNTSTSPALNQTVNKAATITTVSGPTSSNVGQTVTFFATVVPLAPGAGVPSGAVQFKIDGANAPGGLKTLVDGQANYMTNGLSIGTHTITASYQGDNNFRPSSGSMTHRRR